MNPAIMEKPKRSVELTQKERKTLKEYCKGFETGTDAALSMGIDRMVLNRVMFYGSGSPKTIDKIRKALNSFEG